MILTANLWFVCMFYWNARSIAFGVSTGFNSELHWVGGSSLALTLLETLGNVIFSLITVDVLMVLLDFCPLSNKSIGLKKKPSPSSPH